MTKKKLHKSRKAAVCFPFQVICTEKKKELNKQKNLCETGIHSPEAVRKGGGGKY